MIYKFIDGNTGNVLEVLQDGEDNILVSTIQLGGDSIELHLNPTQLYNLIGALHSLQTKIKKGGSNG